MTLSHAGLSPRRLAAGLAAAGLVAAATAVPAQPYRGYERGTLLVLYARNDQCRAKVVDRLVVHRNDSVAWHVLNTCGGAARRVEIHFGASGNPLDAASLATTAADDGRMPDVRDPRESPTERGVPALRLPHLHRREPRAGSGSRGGSRVGLRPPGRARRSHPR